MVLDVAKDSNGSTSLYWAAFNGHVEIATLLVDSGANAREQNNNGHTILQIAIMHRNTDVAKLLIDNGTDFRAKNYLGKIPLSYIQKGKEAEKLIKVKHKFHFNNSAICFTIVVSSVLIITVAFLTQQYI